MRVLLSRGHSKHSVVPLRAVVLRLCVGHPLASDAELESTADCSTRFTTRRAETRLFHHIHSVALLLPALILEPFPLRGMGVTLRRGYLVFRLRRVP